MPKSRRLAREQALQALYSVEVGHANPDEAITEIVTGDTSSEHRQFVRELVLGTVEYAGALDISIAPLLKRWSIERLPVLDRLILRMSVFELQHISETPVPVVINEAVELAKKFSTDESGRYINGVLSALAC